MAKKSPKKKPQYSYADRGMTKVSVPLDAAIDARLTKAANHLNRSKANLARHLIDLGLKPFGVLE